MKSLLFILFTTLLGLNIQAQDTIRYSGFAGNILYESIELYDENTFKWTSEYDLTFSSFGTYKQTSQTLILNYYIDFNYPQTMSLKDSISTLLHSTKSENYIISNNKLYRTNNRGRKQKRIRDNSIRSVGSILFGHKYKLIKIK